MSSPRFKVGDLAQSTGLSVRTLHYYEEIGLLVPSHRTRSGHRLYNAEDILRLQQIKSLRALGFSLDEVRECLMSARFSPLRVIEEHLARAQEQLALQKQIVARLDGIARSLRQGDEVKPEQFLKAMEVMTMWENRFSEEQRKEVHERAQALGRKKVGEIEGEWKRLLADIRAEMSKGTDPKSEHVRTMMARMRELVGVFSGGNQAVEATLRDAYRQGAGAPHGVDAELQSYMERAARG